MNLEEQIALIAGGGSGLGKAFALALSKSGMSVAVTSRSEDRLKDTLILSLASGKADSLSGCYVDVKDDIDGLVLRAEAIQRDQSQKLRLRT